MSTINEKTGCKDYNSDSDSSYDLIRDVSDAGISRDTTFASNMFSGKSPNTAFMEEDSSTSGQNSTVDRPGETRNPLLEASINVSRVGGFSSNLFDVISDHATPSASEVEDTATSINSINTTDKELLDEYLQTSLESLKRCEKEEAVLKDPIDNQKRKIVHPRLKRLDKSSARLNEFLGSIEAKLTSVRPTIITSVIIGFYCACLMFVVYTLMLSSLKSQELEHYANMTQGQRMEKEKYRTQSEEHRESMLHHIQDEVHEASDALHSCQRDLTESQVKVALQTEALRTTQEKLRTVVRKASEVRQSHKKLEEDLKTLRTMKDRYDYTILGGLFICLIAAIILLQPKH